MRSFSKQNGASMPVTLLFIGMLAVILTVAFKLYPAYYEYWQVSAVIESYEKDFDVKNMSANELENNFRTRLLTNNVRTFDIDEGFFVELTDSSLDISVEYEVRINIYNNIDAIVSFEKSVERSL